MSKKGAKVPHVKLAKKNPRVFLEISINGEKTGKLIIELNANITPLTAENFRALCVGKTQNLSYKGCPFHRIQTDFMAQGGDFVSRNGKGGLSIYGPKFPDENFILKHDARGVVSMANSGPDTNSSQFFITFKKLPSLDNTHVVFGKVIDGLQVLGLIEKCATADGTPKGEVIIENCGELK